MERLATGCRIRFEVGETSSGYGTLLYDTLSSLTGNPPSIVNRPPHTKTGVVYHSTQFGTLTLPALQPFYDQFVSNGVRVIPSNIGSNYTAVSLAFSIMNSGSNPE